jgi:hypothetical protein
VRGASDNSGVFAAAKSSTKTTAYGCELLESYQPNYHRGLNFLQMHEDVKQKPEQANRRGHPLSP